MSKRKKVKSGGSILDRISSNEDLMSVISWSVPLLLCLLLLVVVCCVCSVLKTPNNKTIRQQQADIKSLKDEIDVRTNQWNDMQSISMDVSSLQVYTGQEDPNDKIAESFFKRITTWSDGETYEALREELKSIGYDDDSSLMKCFLPEQDITYDGANHRIYEIDTNKANLSFASLVSYRHYVDGGTAHYGAIVQVSTEDLSGESVGSNVYRTSAYVTYDIVEGQVLNVEAAPLVQP